MTISQRIRERAAEVVRECQRKGELAGVLDLAESALLDSLASDIEELPDDPEEGAIRAACMAEAAAVAESVSLRSIRADAIRALATAPSGWVCVKSDDLESLLESILAREDEVKNQTWAWKMATRLRAALPEDRR